MGDQTILTEGVSLLRFFFFTFAAGAQPNTYIRSAAAALYIYVCTLIHTAKNTCFACTKCTTYIQRKTFQKVKSRGPTTYKKKLLGIGTERTYSTSLTAAGLLEHMGTMGISPHIFFEYFRGANCAHSTGLSPPNLNIIRRAQAMLCLCKVLSSFVATTNITAQRLL